MDNFDDIVMAVASGGTATGIAIANYLTGSKLKYMCLPLHIPSNMFIMAYTYYYAFVCNHSLFVLGGKGLKHAA